MIRPNKVYSWGLVQRVFLGACTPAAWVHSLPLHANWISCQARGPEGSVLSAIFLTPDVCVP